MIEQEPVTCTYDAFAVSFFGFSAIAGRFGERFTWRIKLLSVCATPSTLILIQHSCLYIQITLDFKGKEASRHSRRAGPATAKRGTGIVSMVYAMIVKIRGPLRDTLRL